MVFQERLKKRISQIQKIHFFYLPFFKGIVEEKNKKVT